MIPNSPKWGATQMAITWGMGKLISCITHTMECYSSNQKKNEISIHTTGINLKNIMKEKEGEH